MFPYFPRAFAFQEGFAHGAGSHGVVKAFIPVFWDFEFGICCHKMGEYGYFCARWAKGDGVCYVQEYSFYFLVAKEPCVGYKCYGLKLYAGQLQGVQVTGCFFLR